MPPGCVTTAFGAPHVKTATSRGRGSYAAQAESGGHHDVAGDGQPVSAATWYLWDNGRVLVDMDEARKRLEHMRGDTRVALDVLNESDWHTHVSITGHVEQIREGTDLADIDRLAGSTRASRTRSATAPGSARGSP
jgi:hypothetical protein